MKSIEFPRVLSWEFRGSCMGLSLIPGSDARDAAVQRQVPVVVPPTEGLNGCAEIVFK
jgi:hypothetical protein